MSGDDLPTGQRYSLVYARKDKAERDDPRMRVRLSRALQGAIQHGTTLSVELGRFLEGELGVTVVSSGPMSAYVDWTRFFRNAELKDALDTLTLSVKYLRNRTGYQKQGDCFLAQARRILSETQVGYTIDDLGGVHPAHDLNFERNRMSTIAGLGTDRYESIRRHVEDTEKALLALPMDGRQAIRQSFDAVEGLFKIMFPKTTQLKSSLLNEQLTPIIEAKYAERNVAKQAAKKQLASMQDWIDGAHFYRHAEGEPEPMQPPEDLTILLVSQGFAFTRWLAALDKEASPDQCA